MSTSNTPTNTELLSLRDELCNLTYGLAAIFHIFTINPKEERGSDMIYHDALIIVDLSLVKIDDFWGKFKAEKEKLKLPEASEYGFGIRLGEIKHQLALAKTLEVVDSSDLPRCGPCFD